MHTGQFVFAGAKDGSIRVWGVNPATSSFVVQADLAGHVKAVTSIVLVDDVLVTASEDRTIRIWKVPPLARHDACFLSFSFCYLLTRSLLLYLLPPSASGR